ncbi:MAG: regulator of sigma E protease [Myxococcota bacterium]|jgi:regulator of sigma E protease
MTILPALGLLTVLVVVHEFGHLLVARMLGIGVDVFSIGVGRRLWGFSWRGTDCRLSLLPFGGYVMLTGADPMARFDLDPDRDLMRRPPWQRIAVYAGGPLANLVLAVLLFSGLKLASGLAPVSALAGGVAELGTLVQLMGTQLGMLLTGEAALTQSIGGPVEIVRQASDAAGLGLGPWIWLVGAISTSVAIINLLPAPILDGGRILFFTIEAIRGRPVPLVFQERAQQIGVLAMVALTGVVLVADVHRLIA